MPREAQLQIFQRSFSTKGEGRGLGTYSIKLITERYLHGSAGFTSGKGEGTFFYVNLPLAGGRCGNKPMRSQAGSLQELLM